jgi:DNA-binding HxlR family transcriptional regulator
MGMLLNDKAHEIRVGDKSYHCPIDVGMRYVGGKWKAVAVWYLRDGPKRYGELRKLMSGVTERMLSKQLRELELDGLVSRKVYQEVPPHVEYALTDDGKALLPTLQLFSDWSYELAIKRGTIYESQ